MDEKTQELVLRGVLTNSLDNNIISWHSNPEPPLINLLLKCAEENPQVLCSVIKMNKKHGAIYNTNYYALAALSIQKDKKFFREAFPNIIINLSDILNFAELIKGKEGKKYGFLFNNMVKKLLRAKLGDISEEEILKYNKKKRTSDEVVLTDLLKLLHPTFNNPKINDAISWVLGRKSQKEFNRKELPLSWALYQLTQNINEKEILKLIKEYDLNWDMVITRIPYDNNIALSNTITNMTPTKVIEKFRVIIRRGCHKFPFAEDLLLSKLKELEEVPFSINDPFRIFLLWRNLDALLNEKFYNTVARLLNNVKYSEFESITNATLSVFLDMSDSMNVKWIRGDDPDSIYQPTILERGLVHSLLIMNSFSCTDKKFYLFDRNVNFRPVNSDFDTMISKVLSGKYKLSANINAPLKYLLENKIKSDLVFIFTDYDYHYEMIYLWDKYRKNIGLNSKLFLIHLGLSGREYLDLPDCFFRVAQWNDRTPKLITNVINYKNMG